MGPSYFLFLRIGRFGGLRLRVLKSIHSVISVYSLFMSWKTAVVELGVRFHASFLRSIFVDLPSVVRPLRRSRRALWRCVGHIFVYTSFCTSWYFGAIDHGVVVCVAF